MKVKAIQQAHQCPGQNFYVTDNGIKRDYNLLGGNYEFKIYNNWKEVIIEDSKGKIIKKIALPQELRNTTNAKAGKTSKSKGNQEPIEE